MELLATKVDNTLEDKRNEDVEVESSAKVDESSVEIDVGEDQSTKEKTMVLDFAFIPQSSNVGPDQGITLEETFSRFSGEEVSILSQIQQYRKKQVSTIKGGELPTVKVRLVNLSMTATISERSRAPSNVLSAFTKCLRSSRVVKRNILQDLNADFQPGKFTLLLGPPSSGKTVLLRTIAGLIRPSEMVQSGTVLYNGQPISETLKEDLPSVVAYVDQRDQHYPLLTVKETLMFAQACMASQNRILTVSEIMPQRVIVRAKNRPGHELVLNGLAVSELRCRLIMTMLGIEDCADTIVGDDLLRGISGGQKKRVTLGEMIVGRRPVICMDEITTGLDSSTAFDIVQSFKRIQKILGYTVVAALLQPPPEVYELFDNVLLLDAGRVVYHGTRQQVLPYFEKLGYRVPERADVADFLQQVTLPEGRRFRTDPDKHLTPRDFAERSRATYSIFESAPSHFPITKSFAQTRFESAMTVFRRQWTLTTRDPTFARSQIAQAVVLGLLIGTTFYNLDSTDYMTKYGMVFTTTMALSMAATAQIPQIVRERTVFYKQRSANFFRTPTYVLASVLTQLPFNFVCTTIMSVLVYFLTGMNDSGFGFFWAILFFLSLGMGMFFKLVAAAMPDATSAQGLASCTILILILMSGYIIQREEIASYFIWIFHIDPLQWAYTALMINEFRSDTYDAVVVGGTQTVGEAYLEAYQLETSTAYKTYGLLYCIGLCLFSFVGMSCAYQYLNFATAGGGGKDSKDVANGDDDETHSSSLVRKEYDAKEVDLPFVEVEVAFKKLTYTVNLNARGATRDLLQQVDGYAKPGRMTALMGDSGAGKSTLLDVLAGRKTKGVECGAVTTNGFPKNRDVFSTLCGYVEQSDVHSPTATVAEALAFSAALRLPTSVDPELRKRFVHTWIRRLELDVIADRRIGYLDRPGGLSIECRKRVTIGVELVANPSVVFLDEPTSGLDSRAAMLVLQALKAITRSGRTVICTIHQPSAELFRAFQDLLLMQKGGLVCYFGPLGDECSELIRYFESVPGVPKIKNHVNPATWMLQVIGSAKDGTDPSKFARVWRESSRYKKVLCEIDVMMTSPSDGTKAIPLPVTLSRSDRRAQVVTVVAKMVRSYWRTPSYNAFRLVLDTVVGVLVGAVFLNAFDTSTTSLLDGNDYQIMSQAQAMSGISVCFLSAVFCGVININTVISVMMGERPVYYRERAVKMYDAATFSFGMFFAEIPYICIQAGLYVLIAYPMVGFPVNSENDFGTGLGMFYLPFLLYLTMGTSFGMFVAVALPNQAAATIVTSLVNTIWNIYAGFLIPREKIPDPYLALYYTSPIRYALEPLIMSQFYCSGCAKTQSELNEQTKNATVFAALLSSQGVQVPDMDFPTVFDSSCDTECSALLVTTPSGFQVPVYASDFATGAFGFEYDRYWTDVVVLIVFIIGWRALCTLSLHYINHQQR